MCSMRKPPVETRSCNIDCNIKYCNFLFSKVCRNNGSFSCNVKLIQWKIDELIFKNFISNIRWRTIQVGVCSVECGSGEIKQASECIKYFDDGREEVLPETDCRNVPKPSDRTSCYIDCSGRKWIYTDWTSVSFQLRNKR